MSSDENILSQLRGVREPAIPEAAPLSLLAVLAVVLSVVFLVLLVMYYLRRRRVSWINQCIKDLRDLNNSFQPGNTTGQLDENLSQLAQLLRRYVIHVQPPEAQHQITLLHGSAWLHFLDNTFATRYFTERDGQVFGNILYDGGAKALLDNPNGQKQSLGGVCKHLEILLKKHAQRSTLQSRRRHNRQVRHQY